MVDATEFIVRQLTLTLDNDSETGGKLVDAAGAAVRDDMGTGMDRDRFADDLRTGRDHYDYVRVVGAAVAGVIEEEIDRALRGVPEHIRLMFTSILDLHSSETKDALGEQYLPESADDVFGEEESES